MAGVGHHPTPGNGYDTTVQAAQDPRCAAKPPDHHWTTTLNNMEDLTRKHLRATTHACKYATTCAHAMKHLRDLRPLYDSAISAKRCYHDVVAMRLRDEMSIICTHQK